MPGNMNRRDMIRKLDAILPKLNDYTLHWMYRALQDDRVPMTLTNKWVLVNLNVCSDHTIKQLYDLVFETTALPTSLHL